MVKRTEVDAGDAGGGLFGGRSAALFPPHPTSAIINPKKVKFVRLPKVDSLSYLCENELCFSVDASSGANGEVNRVAPAPTKTLNAASRPPKLVLSVFTYFLELAV